MMMRTLWRLGSGSNDRSVRIMMIRTLWHYLRVHIIMMRTVRSAKFKNNSGSNDRSVHIVMMRTHSQCKFPLLRPGNARDPSSPGGQHLG